MDKRFLDFLSLYGRLKYIKLDKNITVDFRINSRA